MDIVAEVLWRGTKEELSITSDDLSWLAKTLGRTRLSRYRQVLQQADENMVILEASQKREGKPEEAQQKVNSHISAAMAPAWVENKAANKIPYEVNHTKVRSYISDALKKLTKKTSEQFIAGKMDKKVLLERIENARKANHKDRSTLNFAKIKRGISIYEIYDKIGLPDYEGYFTIRRIKPFVGKVNVTQLQISYEEKGTIQFLLDDVEDGKISWEVYKVFIEYASEPEGLIDKLKSGNPSAIRKAASKIYKESIFDTPTLDIVARVIWESRNTEDAKLADAIAWLCRAIGKSNNSRYQSLIAQVVETGENSKIRKYAEKQLENFTDEGAPQFLMYSKSVSE